MTLYYQSPISILDYVEDWADALEPGETIAASEWEVEPGMTLGDSTTSSPWSSVFVSGGQAQQTYRLVNRIVTSSGRKDERDRWICIQST